MSDSNPLAAGRFGELVQIDNPVGFDGHAVIVDFGPSARLNQIAFLVGSKDRKGDLLKAFEENDIQFGDEPPMVALSGRMSLTPVAVNGEAVDSSLTEAQRQKVQAAVDAVNGYRQQMSDALDAAVSRMGGR